jgi:hypothetical protein
MQILRSTPRIILSTFQHSTWLARRQHRLAVAEREPRWDSGGPVGRVDGRTGGSATVFGAIHVAGWNFVFCETNLGTRNFLYPTSPTCQ